jgi:hypothetical protein
MKLLWFKGAKGLNVKYDPVRLEYDPRDGVQWLAVAYNVDVDMTGRVSRRKGYETTSVTSDSHSLWSNGEECLFVSGGVLYSLGPDFTATEVVDIGSDNRVSYVSVGPRVYWVNGLSKGIVYGGVAEDWEVPGTIYGPATTRQYAAPPSGEIVGFYRGRLYIAKDNVLWYTEPYGPKMMDYTRNFLPFGDEITMFHPVANGIYVSTSRVVWFLSGSNPQEFNWEIVHNHPVVFGSNCQVKLSLISDDMFGLGVIWTGPDGICLGLPDGRVKNLTAKTLVYETGSKAAGVVSNGKYICTMPDTAEGQLTLVLNLYAMAATQYLNYNFNSYAEFVGMKVGASDSGLMELESGDNDGTTAIQGMFTLPPTDFGYDGNKSIRFLDLSYEANGGLVVTPIADEVNGHETEIAAIDRGNRQVTQKVPIGRYLRGRYFGLNVENLDGADFSIDKITVELAGLLPASR